ncbi:MAG: hypothetical protein ACTSR7_18120, partial [Promethearchaeota archaeon]
SSLPSTSIQKDLLKVLLLIDNNPVNAGLRFYPFFFFYFALFFLLLGIKLLFIEKNSVYENLNRRFSIDF